MAAEGVRPTENAPAPVNSLAESYSEHQTVVFDSLRKSIKATGDMFLFGEPTDSMVRLMVKIYHENILRILSEAVPPGLKWMFGIMVDDKDELYVTISESPGVDSVLNSPTDRLYMDKRMMMLNILKSAGIDVEYPEADLPRAFPPPVFADENRWRKGPRGGDDWNTVFQAKKIRAAIESKPSLKNAMAYNPGNDSVNLYLGSIRSLPCKPESDETCTVKWVDSVEYLTDRLEGKETFIPYKKYSKDDKKKVWKAECNNGHLCTESKLFAYAKKHGIKFKSFVAYWLGGGTPPEDHIIRSYCYRTEVRAGDNEAEVKAEAGKLDALAERCGRVLTFDALKALPNYPEIMKRVVQPIAVACPGCFANISAYMSGTMKKWNASNCYVPRRAAKGGRRTRRRATRKNKSRKSRR